MKNNIDKLFLREILFTKQRPWVVLLQPPRSQVPKWFKDKPCNSSWLLEGNWKGPKSELSETCGRYEEDSSLLPRPSTSWLPNWLGHAWIPPRWERMWNRLWFTGTFARTSSPMNSKCQNWFKHFLSTSFFSLSIYDDDDDDCFSP